MAPSASTRSAELRIGLLGPVEVHLDGVEVGPAGARRRGVLALLALQPRTVVPVATLVDRLWGDDAPGTAVNVVQTYVSTWRRVLGGTQGVVRTVGSGYRLDIADEECDLALFRALAATARERAGAGDLEGGERAWEQALELWRGPALADLAGSVLHRRFAPVLEEERLAALEQWADLALQLDRDASLIVERLSVSRTADPLRESLAALLLRAEAAAGRPSTALAVYDELRRNLRDELGSDPGIEVQKVYERVLRGEPEPVTHPPVRNLASGVPRGPGDTLVGRASDMDRVASLLAVHRHVTLTGPGGCGKTRLAVELARRWADAGRLGWFADLGPLTDATRGPSVIAAAVGVQPAAGADVETALAVSLREVRGLLVLDNLEHLPEVGPMVARLISQCPSLIVLATSRVPLRIAGEQRYDVPLLAVPESSVDPEDIGGYDAVRLLVDRANSADGDFRVTADNAGAVARIVRLVDGLPLALELVAPWLRVHAPGELAARLESSPLDISSRRTDLPERHRTLRDTIDWSCRLLAEPERRLFRRLAVAGGGFTLDLAREVAGAGEGAPESEALAEAMLALLEGNLVVPTAPVGGRRRFRLLQPMKEYALEMLEHDPDRDAVRERFVRAVRRWAIELAIHSEGPTSGEWLALAVAEADNLRAAIASLRESDSVDDRLQLVVNSMVLWFEAGHEQEGEDLLAEALKAAGRDAQARSIALTYWAWIRAPRDPEAAEAAAAEALAVARSAGDPLVESFALQTLGDTISDPEQARQASEDVFAAAARGEGRPVRYGPTAPDAVRCGASASIASKWAHRSVPEALRWQRAALELAEVEGDRRITAVNAARLAHVHLLTGNITQASRLLGHARSQMSTIITARWEDIVAFSEAELLFHTGRIEDAERRLRALVAQSEAGGRSMHRVLGSLLLVDLYSSTGRCEDADAVLARQSASVDDSVRSAAWGVRRARVERLTGDTEGAAQRLETVADQMPTDALPPERIIWLLESASTADDCHRAMLLAQLDEAERATGVRLPPWEEEFRAQIAHREP